MKPTRRQRKVAKARQKVWESGRTMTRLANRDYSHDYRAIRRSHRKRGRSMLEAGAAVVGCVMAREARQL